jgi:hypothetical protein
VPVEAVVKRASYAGDVETTGMTVFSIPSTSAGANKADESYRAQGPSAK